MPTSFTRLRCTTPLQSPSSRAEAKRSRSHAARHAVRLGTILLIVFALAACDFGGGDEDELEDLNPDDIQVALQEISGTTRDEMKATITSSSERTVDMVNLSVFFHDAEDVQIGQMPFVFLGEYNRGDRAEQQLGLPANVERHADYACYRYRIGVTGDGHPANKTYSGTCN